MTTFEEALAAWKKKADACLDARVKYERQFAIETLGADGKNAEQRKAQVDSACLVEWAQWKAADIEAIEAWQIVLHLTSAAPAARPVLA